MGLARNVFGLLERSAESRFGDRPGFGFEGEQRTFRDMRDSALAVAGGLHAQGVRPGDKVAVMMGNRLEWVELYFGLAALGAVCVPVNVLLTGPEIAHVCRDSGSRCLVADEVAAQGLGGLDQDFDVVITVGDVEGPRSARPVEWAEIATGHTLPRGHVGPDLGDTFLLYYSSGTTGLPKAAEHSHNGVLWNAMGQLQGLSLTEHDRYFVISSLSWAAGFHNVMMALTWVGGYSEVRRTGGATMENIVASIEEHRITHVMLVPSLLRELVARPDLMERLSASSLRPSDGSRRSAGRSSPRSTARRWAAASRSPWPATTGSRWPGAAACWGCPRSRSAYCPAPEASPAPSACSASWTP